MKLKNKKTGEIGEPITIRHDGTVFVVTKIGMPYCKESILGKYRSLAELNEEWEDYEEPKDHWHITFEGVICDLNPKALPEYSRNAKAIGNYFETREEAEAAVEKLKAWKRLKDKGFRLTWSPLVGSLDKNPEKFQIEINADMPAKWFSCDDVQKDLEICFGGEE